jgi:mono/diheme cytochrome c family protein
MKQPCQVYIGLAVLVILAGADRVMGQRWREMDYGPFLTSTLEVDRENFAYKSLSIRLDEGQGGVTEGSAFVSFDTDTLRYAAAWLGPGLMDWRNVVFDGSHGTHPSLIGQRVFVNPARPGWGNPRDGTFEETRVRGVDGRAYGPLDRSWGRWKGLYRHGDRVILSYSVGTTDVLDMPGLEVSDSGPVITRSLQISARAKDLVLQVASQPDRRAQLREIRGSEGRFRTVGLLVPQTTRGEDNEQPRREYFSLRGDKHFLIENAADLNLTTADFTISARLRTNKDGTIFSKTAPSGPWVPNGKTLFVREGHLCYDIGWVGDVETRKRVDDNRWHEVAATYDADSGKLRLYIDGALQATRELRPSSVVQGHVARIGYTAANFPRPKSAFEGDIDYVRFFQRCLTERELRRSQQTRDAAWLATWSLGEERDGAVLDSAGGHHDALLTQVGNDSGYTGVAVACLGLNAPDYVAAPDGSLRLRVPAGDEPLEFKLLFMPCNGEPDQLETLLELVDRSPPVVDLPKLSRGGPPLWPQVLRTETTSLDESADGTFEAETLTIPQQNPWRSWMRLGGFDFFADADRAAVCSWQGDVWTVSGLTDRSGQLRWRRIASGLFQPLGLKIVDDHIYVLGRDQITRLHDLNGDGETDFYENFHNQMQVTDHFHEFAMDLQTDRDGNFYFMKAARHALPAVVPQHGTLIQVTRDGRESRVLARGFRAPDGLLVNGDGTFVSSDQEGHWTPMNRINWIRPGGFYGNMMAANPHRVETDAADLPVCWIHRTVDRSPTAQVWVPADHWGSLGGALLSLSYGTGKTFRVLYENVGDVMQGGIVQLPIPELPTGIQRGRFHPSDGQLYVCGLFGWSSDKTLAGGFYRIRHTGKEVTTPSALSACSSGVWLEFPQPLAETDAGEPSNFRVSRWNYQRTANYGSEDYRVSDGKPGRDRVRVEHVSVSSDRRSVFLHVGDMVECMQMRVDYKLQGAERQPMAGSVDLTVNALHEPANALRDRFTDQLRRQAMSAATASQVDKSQMRRGLVLSVSSPDDVLWDQSVVRTVALRTDPDTSPTLLAGRGAFRATWSGYINADLPGAAVMRADLEGALQVRLNGQLILDSQGAANGRFESQQAPLRSGLNAIQVQLVSLTDGRARLRLHWQRDGFVSELIRPEVLLHDSDAASRLSSLQQLRMGRALVAQARCLRCHDADTLPEGMPELALDTPSLASAGDRFQATWLTRWISDPRAVRNDISMPHVLADSSSRERADIVAYVMSLRGDVPDSNQALSETADDDTIEQGLYLYEDLGCIACHHLEPPDYDDPYDRTSLHFVSAKYRRGALVRYLRQPHEFYTARRMPDFQLELSEAAALAAYLRDATQTMEPVAEEGGDVQRGEKAFTSRGCAACHTVETSGELPLPNALPLGRLSNTSSGCLAQDDSQRGDAPEYTFDRTQRIALAAFLRSDQSTLLRESTAEAAERYVQLLRCNACHRRDAQLPTLPEVIAEEGEQGYPAESLPPLTWTGEKLQGDWLLQLFSGQLDYSARPWKRGRMPAFPAYALVLAQGLAAQHGVTASREPNQAPDPELAEVGERLTQQGQGFHCLQCHGLPDRPPEAPFESRGIDFQYVEDRLRADFYQRWIGNPIQFDTSVPMPRFSPDGRTTPVKNVLAGDARRQFDAIWEYLRTVDKF